MFTVLHKLHGVERLFEAEKLSYKGPHATTGPNGVILDDADGASVDDRGRVLHYGSVYVMNESGATVASYILGDPPHSTSGIEIISSR